VAMQCLEYSLRFREPYGTWGGITEDERQRILRHTDARAVGERPSTHRQHLDD
jgi:WhiB family transcriptional regulator, redox-sensing transcriptional regulator